MSHMSGGVAAACVCIFFFPFFIFSRAETLAMLALSEHLRMQTDRPEDAHKQHHRISIIS